MFLAFKTGAADNPYRVAMPLMTFAAATMFALISPSAVAATPPLLNTNPAAAVLAAMYEASGGARWIDVRSLHVTGELHDGGQTAPVEDWEDVRTGRYRVRETWPSFVAEAGFDGVTPWRARRSGIAYALGDPDAARGAADEAYRKSRAWWFADRLPATVALVGSQVDAGRAYDVLEVTPEGGRPFKAWVDQVTHLLARTDEQQAEERVITIYGDYRLEKGLMLPFAIRTSDGADPAADQLETVRSVEVNVPIPDGLYALPPRPASDIELPHGGDSVDVPFQLTADNRILVPLRVNDGPTLQAEFDSGGSLILQPATVVALHLAAAGSARQSGGGEGSLTASSGRVDHIAIGEAVIRNAAFHSFVFDDAQPDKALVGLEVLQRFVVRFDFDRQVMTLTRPMAFAYSGRGAIVPFHIQDNQPEVRGSIDGISGLFSVDTGDNGSLLLIAPFARRHDLVRRYRADMPYDGKAVGATHGVWARQRVDVLALDGADGRTVAEVRRPITRISLQTQGFDADRDVSGNIGLGVLRRFNVTFDYSAGRLILEPNHLRDDPDVFNRAGLRLRRDGLVWSVSVVYGGSPAEEAGLKVGDVVKLVDDEPPALLDDEQLAARLKGPTGTSLKLLVRLPVGEKLVVLRLRDLL